MNELDGLAEICGIHAGDGYLRHKDYKVELDISGSIEEETYYDNHVIPLFSRFFKIKIRGQFFPSRRTYGFVIRNKEVVEKMHRIGFPYGEKSSRVRIPSFVLYSKNEKLKALFLRGFFDTDGSLSFGRRHNGKYCSFKKKFNYYPVLTLTTVSGELAEDLQKLLKDLDIRFWYDIKKYKQTNWRDSHRIWIKGTAFLKWMRIIGMKNPHKLSRYLIWEKYGHCPTNTSFMERLSILNGDIKIIMGPVWQPG